MATRLNKMSGRGTASITPKSRTDRLLVELFRAHWRALESDISRGVDIAKRRGRFIFATDAAIQSRMARRWYALSRARKLAKASADQVLRWSEPWFGAFCNEAEDWSLDGRELRKAIRTMVGSEYIALSWFSPAPFQHPCDDRPLICAIPTKGVVYDDVYEITAAGVSCGALLSVCKSVAVPFGKFERCQATIGIEREFHCNAAEAGEPEGAWRLTFRDCSDSRIIEAVVEPARKGHLRRSRVNGLK